jgi:hypothetical protein
MSYAFDLDEETVWSPGNIVGALYVGMVTVVAEALEAPTGLTDAGSGPGWTGPLPNAEASTRLSDLTGDWFRIDREHFPALVRRMLSTYTDVSNPDLRLLLGSVLAVSIGILDRAGLTLAPSSEAEEAAISQLREAYL